jgi:CelD/BcsL family acetyltransferase involved in cellulose biosynthesis
MVQATHAAFDARHEIETEPASSRSRASAASGQDLRLSIHDNLHDVEQDWRAFERSADCTVFQSFDWVSAWQRHIGVRNGVTPAIVVVRDGGGGLLMFLPLAIERGSVRRLTYLASDLCDYNTPLLAPDFSRLAGEARFAELWRDILERLRSHPDYRYDLIQLEKMPEQVGAQRNPMRGFAATLNPSNAYATPLGDDWERFYTAKRSSATRRRDRTKRNKLAQFGDVTFVNPARPEDVAASFEILMQQKTQQFARMGVPNIFAHPGYPEFYRDVAARRPDMVHISRLDVGTAAAALNYGLIFRGRYYHVLASYTDHEMSKFGPGAAHLHDLMSHAIARGCTVFDFTIGDERYKRDWCESDLKLYDYVAMATARGAVVAGPLLALGAAKRWIKQTPAVWNAVSKVRAMLATLRGKPAATPAE